MTNKKEHLQKLDDLKKQALGLMEDAGYPLTGDIEVILDENLPFMGYTTEKAGQPIIVVAGMALSGGMALNLLVHEMSHVYRSQSGHPSHNYTLLTSITAFVTHGKVVEQYQEKILHTIVNNIQDLYADDISFKIFDQHTPQENLSNFFMSWIKKPVTRSDPTETAWINADHLLSAAFAQANLERHNVPDTRGRVDKAVQNFLSQIDKRMAKEYPYFKKLMANLPEKVTVKEFERLLIQYLNHFIKLTNIS